MVGLPRVAGTPVEMGAPQFAASGFVAMAEVSAVTPMATVLGPGSFAAWERNVVRLAGRAHSVRQIGERLSIGERTVETDLSNVYAKLGVRSTSELAGRRSQFGL